MSLIVVDKELTQRKHKKELGLFIHGNVQGFSFCPPKHYKPNEQTTYNTNHMRSIAWSSGKFDYDNYFLISFTTSRT